ncbi:hypothetical protein PsorP6_002205 [Peronosclerospora sorghi]|uniref:Uncharacterized protein n=1 Tax=Peronosclerospora sorghi TaxID=230839 RepID=A0ACC0WVM8_9STRA|nr:hypothetical protein PsorP6_002205 [Peronosclerospora sorghi]
MVHVHFSGNLLVFVVDFSWGCQRIVNQEGLNCWIFAKECLDPLEMGADPVELLLDRQIKYPDVLDYAYKTLEMIHLSSPVALGFLR